MSISRSIKLKTIFNVVCLFYFFISSNVWLNFKLPSNLIIALVSVILLLILQKRKKFIPSHRTQCLFLVLLLLSAWGIFTVSFSYGILSFFYYFPAILLTMLSIKQKENTLSFITKWFSIIMLISIIIFVLTLKINIPSIGIFQLSNNDRYPPFINYVFFIKSTDLLDQIIYRFNGPFLEPGHLSVVCSFLLFTNKYNFRQNKWLWIPLICVIISMSLAGYVITAIGWLLLKINNIKTVVLISCICIIGYVFTTHIWNSGDNIMNQLIVSRLEYDEEKGIAGNNRTTETTDNYYKHLQKQGKLWKGLGSIEKERDIVGAGYKIYFMRFGIISALLVAIFYMNLLPKHYNKRYVYSFCIILIITFIQRAYPWWFSWLLCFTLGTGINIYETKPVHINIDYSPKSIL